MEYALSSRQHGLPCNGELYICVDESIKAKLRLKLALFYPTPVVKLRQEKKVTMFIYSSLRLLGMERSGVGKPGELTLITSITLTWCTDCL